MYVRHLDAGIEKDIKHGPYSQELDRQYLHFKRHIIAIHEKIAKEKTRISAW